MKNGRAGRAVLSFGRSHARYGARFYSPALGRFLSAATLVPGAAQSQAYDRYAYVMNSPLVYSDPSGHYYQWGSGPGKKPTTPAPVTPLIPMPTPANPPPPYLPSPTPHDIINPPIVLSPPPISTPTPQTYFIPKPTAGSDESINPFSTNERPSIATLLIIGIPLTGAIVLVETGLTIAEVEIALSTIAQPEIAPATIPLELFLSGASLFLIDIEIAYWSYVYRVAFTPEGEPVKFELLPLWGISGK